MKIKNQKGFTLIEVLIATLILAVSIISINAAFKQFSVYKQKMDKYKKIYITTLSLKDMIENEDLKDNIQESGILNGLKYSYKVKLINKIRNHSLEETEGNTGDFEIYLFQITLNIDNKEYRFFKTKYVKVSGFQEGL
jgi:prepilin-type N-terminal cleavage/methylation domain-containing protein